MLATGVTVGPYEILGLLGAGGMGEVYRAREGSKLDRDVAIKVLPSDLARDRERPRSVRAREAKAVAAALWHPNILSIFNYGTHDHTAYAVMELLEGETLRGALKRGPMRAEARARDRLRAGSSRKDWRRRTPRKALSTAI